jgi:hypothetical protein
MSCAQRTQVRGATSVTKDAWYRLASCAYGTPDLRRTHIMVLCVRRVESILITFFFIVK